MSENTTAGENQINKKDKVQGKVVKTTLAGAVVDMGAGKLAVIPISQLRKDPVRRVEDILKVGDSVEAWVRRVDPNQDRVELTLIQPLAMEWRDLKKDMVVNGKVTKLEKFGAFVEIGAERPGLMHVSEMSHDYVKKPEDVVTVGQEVEVRILDVDRRKKQIKLSMKVLTPKPVAEEQETEEPEKPAPTAMEIALRKAMSEEGEPTAGAKTNKGRSAKKPAQPDMEDILARTLENRPKSR
jgi:small subunit ribosomal protein S1